MIGTLFIFDRSPIFGAEELIFKSVSENGSIQLAQKSFSPNGGHLICINFDLGTPARDDVKTETTIASTLHGKGWIKSDKIVVSTYHDERPSFVRWLKIATDLFAKGEVKPLEVEHAGKLEDIGKALEKLMKGENKEKLVLSVA